MLWFVLTSLGSLVSLLPRRLELFLGTRLGRVAHALGGFKRRTALENIRHCFPEWTQARRDELLRKNSEHMGLLFFEFLHFFSPIPGHYRAYAIRISRLNGTEHWDRALAKGKGVLFMSCHVGFWEMLAAAGGLSGRPLTIVTTVLKPAWLNKTITDQRLSTGVKPAYHPGSIPTVMKALRKGESVAFMNDQYAKPPMGVAVPFFGIKVDTLAAVGPLAKRTGAAVVPVSCWRDEEGILQVMIEPELELGDAMGDAEKATAVFAAKVETWVRAHPDQWLWIHRRFKNVVWPQDAAPDSAPARAAAALA